MNFGEEGGRAMAGGLMAPRKKTLVQPAARWLLRRRPFKPELIDRLCHDADERYVKRTSVQRAGSVTKPDNSSMSEAARERLSSISPLLTLDEIMLLAAAESSYPR